MNGGFAVPAAGGAECVPFGELGRVADLYVADASGLSTAVSGRMPEITPVTRGGYALSPDMNTFAYAAYAGDVFGITVWHRDTGVLDHYDLDTGSGTPDTVVVPEAVSNGGTRLVFS